MVKTVGISISNVLRARTRIWIARVVVVFVIAGLSFVFFSLRNPKKIEAAVTCSAAGASKSCADPAVDTVTLTGSDKYYVNYKGDLMAMPGVDQDTLGFDSFNLENKNIVINGSATKVTFAGPLEMTDGIGGEKEIYSAQQEILDQCLENPPGGLDSHTQEECDYASSIVAKFSAYRPVQLAGLTVDNGAQVQHMGPENNGEYDSKNYTPAINQNIGVVFEGWIRSATPQNSFSLNTFIREYRYVDYYHPAKLWWAQGDAALVHTTNTSPTIDANTTYHFKIHYVAASGEANTIKFDRDISSLIYAHKKDADSSTNSGKMLAKYYSNTKQVSISEENNQNDTNNPDSIYSETETSAIFSPYHALTPQITEDAFTASNHFPAGDIHPDIAGGGAGRRRLSLSVTGDVRLVNNGKIEVSYLGMKGGVDDTDPLKNGYSDFTTALGGGRGEVVLPENAANEAGAGGGAYRGNGGGGYNIKGGATTLVPGDAGQKFVADPIDQDDPQLPFYLGSGGGLAYANTPLPPEAATGSSGGGSVNLSIGGMLYIDTSGLSGIYANGTDVTAINGNRGYNGGGSGGSIGIKATKISLNKDGKYPLVTAGDSGSLVTPAEAGVIEFAGDAKTETALSDNIQAKGGMSKAGTSGGGGGSGGWIVINYDEYVPDCWVRPKKGQVSIPATCEGKDVVIDAELDAANTVYADRVKIIQSDDIGARVECFDADSGNPSCDTKRKFKSVALVNGAILTHDPISRNASTRDPVSGFVSVMPTGTDRWRKVDIEVEETFSLDTGSKIDVSGKGYPGGSMGSGRENGFGPGFGKESYYATAVDALGAGGNYNGLGGPGNLTALPQNTIIYADKTLEAGSGGGTAFSGSSSSNGGSGGGRVKIVAVKGISFLGGSTAIYANGSNGSISGKARGGGGAGGSIYLEAPYYENNATLATALLGGSQSSAAQKGAIGSIDPAGTIGPFTVTGGNGGNTSTTPSIWGGGGSGGKITIVFTSWFKSSMQIKKSLSGVTRGGIANSAFNPYALQLGDVINVALELTGVPTAGTFSAEDAILQTQESGKKIKCVPIEGSISDSGVFISTDNKVFWSGLASSSGTKTVSYQCQVTTP